jgi:hypothetical protein
MGGVTWALVGWGMAGVLGLLLAVAVVETSKIVIEIRNGLRAGSE